MRLLESQTERERRGGGTMTSVVVHVAIIVAAVIGTVHAEVPKPDIVIEEFIPFDPPNDPKPVTGSRTNPSGPTQGQRITGPVLTAPTVIGDEIPPIDLDTDVNVVAEARADFTVGSGSGAAGGTSHDVAYGVADADGVWSSRTVEVAVVPDAHNPSPSYPEMLRTAGITGQVLVEFVVDSTGRVRPGSLQVVESTHELFTSSVRRTIPSFRFTPARVQGRRVAQRVRVPFEFAIER